MNVSNVHVDSEDAAAGDSGRALRVRPIGLFLIVVACCLGGFLLAENVGPPRKTIEAERFIARSPEGRVSAELGAVGDEFGGTAGLRLYDSNEKLRGSVSIDREGTPTVVFNDRFGRASLLASVDEKVGAGITIWGNNAYVRLIDSKGEHRATLILADGAPILSLADAQGEPGFAASVEENGEGKLKVRGYRDEAK